MKSKPYTTPPKGRHLLRKLLAAVLLTVAAGTLQAQVFTSFRLPTDLCSSQTQPLTFGFNSQNDVVVSALVATLNSAERAFLPDGEPCDPYGCSYRSTITFTDFPSSSRISSVNDIKYVRLNIEHSYIGDLYINITCPNGQKADLMRFGGSLTSACSDAIPSSSASWLSGSNMGKSTYFGEPVDYEDSETCDASAYDNRPGVGWNYCWSNNDNSGFSYAPGDAIIYRSTNSSNNESVDSSDVANRSNFYHPDDNLSALIGCPLNGAWYIEVVDGWGGDNGYIFDWELSLDASLLPVACDIASRSVLGDIVQRINDSTYTLTTPSTISRDTVVQITVRAINTCGDTIDSVAHITLHPNPVSNTDTTVCDLFNYNGRTYYASQPVVNHFPTLFGCDSTENINLTVNRSTTLDTVIEIVENLLPVNLGGESFTSDIENYYITGLTNSVGCDSTIHLTLRVMENWHTIIDSTICEHQLPFLWNGLNITGSNTYEVLLVSTSGADSIVTLNLTVRPDSRITVRDTAIEAQLPVSFAGRTFLNDIDTVFRLANQWQCDSIVIYRLKVWHNFYIRHDTVVCGTNQTVSWRGFDFHRSTDTLLRHTSIHGTDSNTRLVLVMAPTYNLFFDTTICEGDYFRLGTRALSESGDYRQQFISSRRCDSTVAVSLTVIPSYADTVSRTACYPNKVLFESQWYEHSGTYTHHFRSAFGCDSLKTMLLNVGGERLLARASILPLIVDVGDPTVELTSLCRDAVAIRWIIGDFESEAQHFFFDYPVDNDTLALLLEATDSSGCKDTLSTVLRLDRTAVTAPNVFTPNLESNNRWSVVLSGTSEAEVWIYNRRGVLVHHYDSPDGYWDGTSNGTPCPQDTYIYFLRYRRTLYPNQIFEATGTIVLLR